LEISEIKIGKTYEGIRGGARKVIEIKEEHRPEFVYTVIGGCPDGPGVLFALDNNLRYTDYLAIFAAWAVRELR
jgi:hypothetical protein